MFPTPEVSRPESSVTSSTEQFQGSGPCSGSDFSLLRIPTAQGSRAPAPHPHTPHPQPAQEPQQGRCSFPQAQHTAGHGEQADSGQAPVTDGRTP